MDNAAKPTHNLMGSEVVEGYACKPQKLDPNKPIMYYHAIVYVCSDERCAKAGGEEKAAWLRDVVKDMGLHTGKQRIKVSRSLCQGACRFRQVVQINAPAPNDKLWLKHTHTFDRETWVEILRAIRDNKAITENRIEMRVYKEQGL